MQLMKFWNKDMENSTVCFIVASERFDGKFPKPEKCWHDLLFFDIETATEFLEECRKCDPKAAIFKCHIEIVEKLD